MPQGYRNPTHCEVYDDCSQAAIDQSLSELPQCSGAAPGTHGGFQFESSGDRVHPAFVSQRQPPLCRMPDCVQFLSCERFADVRRPVGKPRQRPGRKELRVPVAITNATPRCVPPTQPIKRLICSFSCGMDMLDYRTFVRVILKFPAQLNTAFQADLWPRRALLNSSFVTPTSQYRSQQ